MLTGDQIGPYRIIEKLGEGGMGQVFRARDARLDRDVAIKVLPQVAAADPDRRARFEREARALASLNHPHIAQIYGTEDVDGVFAIVMELVEGEDLAARLSRGPMRWTDAQPVARQIAEALDAAHERGIIHRDLKPANIRVTAEDTVKVLDFGLARMMSADEAMASDPSSSPTLTSPGTQLGTIIGTAAYMAPEQAKGRAVDKRADIWAFGVLLFEMLTGRSPFAAASAVESLSHVVMKDPDWPSLPPDLPPRVAELLRRCLVKEPRSRLRDIGDALHVLNASSSEEVPPPARATAAPGRRNAVVLAAAFGLVLAALAAVIAWTLKPAASLPLRRLELPQALASSRSVAISPDGMQLAYISEGRLFVRALDDTVAREIAQMHPTAELLVWSPDSRSVAFFAQGNINTVPARGGQIVTVCRVPGAANANDILWHPDGSIIFSAWRDSLYQVAGVGGTPELLLPIDPNIEIDFHEIGLAPDDRLLVHVHRRAENTGRLELVEIAGAKRRTVLSEDPSALDFAYASGMLLFRRVGDNQGLWALPFSDDKLDVTRAVPLAPGATSFSASNEGTLVFQASTLAASTMEWLADDGAVAQAPGAPIVDLYPWISVSPDRTRVAYVARRTQPSLYVRDLATGADTQVVASQGGQNIALGSPFMLVHPTWFSTGDRLLYVRGAVEASELVMHRADGAGEPSVLGKGAFGRVTPDGSGLVWTEDDRGQYRLRYAPLDKDGKPGEARNGFPGSDRVSIRWFDLSPDGKLLAYVASETTLRSNIHLVSFPDGNSRWQVTTDGGTYVQFSSDGRALFYFTGTRAPAGAPEGRMMTMPLDPGPPVKLGVPAVRFASAEMPAGFDVAGDGRLLVARRVPVAPGEESRAILVQNWPSMLQQSRQ